jgi:hypothetical protein
MVPAHVLELERVDPLSKDLFARNELVEMRLLRVGEQTKLSPDRGIENA